MHRLKNIISIYLYNFIIIIILLPWSISSQVIDSINIIREIDSLSKLNMQQCASAKYDEAINAIKQAEELAKKTLGRENAKYAYTLFLHGRTQYLFGHLPEAEKLYLNALQIQKSDPGINDVSYAWTLNNLGGLYWKLGKYQLSETYYTQAIERRKFILGEQHRDYAWSLHNLGSLYLDMGYYEKAESLYQQAMQIREKNPGKLSVDYGYSLNHLAILNMHLGNYKKSEQLHLEALHTFQQVYKNNHPDIAWVTGNLGNLYERMGIMSKAEDYVLQTLEIRQKIFGKNNSDYAFALTALGRILQYKGEYKKAEECFLESQTIREKVYGINTIDHVNCLANLAFLYDEMNSDKAEQFWLKSYSLSDSLKFQDPENFAKNLLDLGSFYLNHQDYLQADHYLSLASQRISDIFGKHHALYANVLDNLTELNIVKKNFKDAITLSKESSTIHKQELLNARSHLSENELGQYLNRFKYKLNLDYILAGSISEYAEYAYNNTLLYKNFLLQNVKRISNIHSKDSSEIVLLKDLKSYQRALGMEFEKPIDRRTQIKKLQQNIEKIEKNLASRVTLFDKDQKEPTCKDLQKLLSKGQAAIEFIRYESILDSNAIYPQYAALLIKYGSDQVQFISLCNEKQLSELINFESARKSDFVNELYSIRQRGASRLQKEKLSLYACIWKPMENYLSDIQTIFVASSGMIFRINLDAIPIRENIVLADQFHLINLQSTKQISSALKRSKLNNKDAILFGGLEYTDSSSINSRDQNSLDNTRRKATTIDSKDEESDDEYWEFLPGTEREVSVIEKILMNSGFKTQKLIGFNGTESSFKKLGSLNRESPALIHIATHGYFYSDIDRNNSTSEVSNQDSADTNVLNDQPIGTSKIRSTNQNELGKKSESIFKISEHPMLRSGLILSGGNPGWKGNQLLDDQENGILTAYEISQMNLSNTELVVLSACETGLGDIQGNEGVYGLQRAFKIAGAKYLIMSLWQVPDKQTSLLMTTFYKEWLENNMDIPDAFHAAQKELRDSGLDPYQWAGFVLVE